MVTVARVVSISSPSRASSSVIGVAENVNLKKNGQFDASEGKRSNYSTSRQGMNAYTHAVWDSYSPVSGIRRHR